MPGPKAKARQLKGRIQDDILRRHGLQRAGQGRLKRSEVTTDLDPFKTLAMRLVEQVIGIPLEDVLWDGTVRQVAKRLDVDYSTVSKWRKRLEEADGR